MTKEIRIRIEDKVHRDLKKRAALARRTLAAQVAHELEQAGVNAKTEAAQ